MTYPPQAALAFRRVLVGWDCSAGAAAALRAAAAIADQSSGHVIALAVLRPAPHSESREENAADLATRREHARKTFRQARDELDADSRSRVSLHFAEAADAARAVCEYADSHGFDLLVIGRHGAGGLLHAKLGRVAQAAARNSRLTVLLAA
ncbi:MAG TPA: universal stress protein [Trebonia sp.]|jgi:nucleotide-binding universal stress UspA family protein